MARIRCISLKDEQDNFVDEQGKFFKLSRFVQDRLDEYMKFKEGLKDEEKANKEREGDMREASEKVDRRSVVP